MSYIEEEIGKKLTDRGFIKEGSEYYCSAPMDFRFNKLTWKALYKNDLPPFKAFESLLGSYIDSYICDLNNNKNDDDFIEIKNHIHIGSDLSDWLEIPVRLNLGLNVDAYSEYTLNTVYPAYLGEDYDSMNKGQFKDSSIMWLTRRQGYKQSQLRNALYSIKDKNASSLIKSPYLYSAAKEVWNELSIFNQLGFFVIVPIKELLLLITMEKWGKQHKKWPGYILLDSSVRCGFYTSWEGSCSALGIKLEKPVKLPLNVSDIEPDDSLNGIDYYYSLYDVCNDESIWQPEKILHWGLPRQFRRDASKWGVLSIPDI